MKPWELIPILSYLLLGGRCSGCNKRISVLYPFLEVTSAALFVIASFHHADLFSAVLLALLLWLLLLIGVIDMQTKTISDALSIPLIFIGITYNILVHGSDFSGLLLGLGFFGIQWAFSRGKWMGSGDVFLGVGIGAMLGSSLAMILCLYIAYVLAMFIVVFRFLQGSIGRRAQIAFGPYLAIGTLSSILLQQYLFGMFIF